MLNERRECIVTNVNDKGYVTIEELSVLTDVSLATLRTDLDALHEEGRLIRLRGVAISTRVRQDVAGVPKENRALRTDMPLTYEKQRIAGCCRGLLTAMDTIFLDNSNTNFILATDLAELKNFPLSIITNSLDIFQVIRLCSHLNAVLCGGDYEMHTHSLVGEHTLRFIKEFHADYAFITARGFHVQKGASTYYSRNTAVRRAMMENARQTVMMGDHSKFDFYYAELICTWDDVKCIVTDQEPSSEYIDIFYRKNIRLILPE
jgi:DeoR family transcriptional regulator of aga operon/DeoR family fructose operon transcriptional repressor